MPEVDFLLTLTREALTELDQASARLSPVMRKAIRIARLRNDWEAVYWLSMELDTLGDKHARDRRISEVAPYFTREEWKRIHDRSVEQSIASRTIAYFNSEGELEQDKVASFGIPELEEVIANLANPRREPLPANLHHLDAALLSERRRKTDERTALTVGELTKVKARLAQRTHTYLSRVERQLTLGQQQGDFFEHNRRYVEQNLGKLSPPALEQLKTASLRAGDGTAEGRSHALMSCRRALKSLADRLYAPRTDPVWGGDGKERVLDESKFVARLWQYLAESSAGATAKKLLQTEVEQLGTSVDRLNDLSSKGVHADVTPFEVNACVLSMYTLVGALLRLQSEESAASLDPSTLRDRDS